MGLVWPLLHNCFSLYFMGIETESVKGGNPIPMHVTVWTLIPIFTKNYYMETLLDNRY